jgi:putative ATPase
LYDKEGDVHYDTISAFIKSLRGSDPDATLYWMAKMVYAGEDPRFIFRRMAILAGEDVGLADPNAAVVVASCWELYERVGMPEGRFPLAEAALYLATCPKSNSTLAFFDALSTVEQEQESDVPNHLKDGNRDSEGFGHGQGYLYPHAYRDHWVAQQYLPDALQGKVFYEPGDQGYEQHIRKQVARRREAQLAAMVEADSSIPEVLTTSPTNRAKDDWLQRAIANSGRNLGRVRDELFEMAQIQRHHLVLDIEAGSGLLTWEAVRLAPEGGVWTVSSKLEVGEVLRQQAQRLPEIERPAVLIGAPNELDYLMDMRGESEVRFDCILGRNAFSSSRSRLSTLALVASKLQVGGRLCLAQVIPRQGQRLYELVDWSKLSGELADKVRVAEEAIYHDPSDELVNWDVNDLESDLRAATLANLSVHVMRQVDQRKIGRDHFDRWFGSGLSGISDLKERLSYRQRLIESGLEEEEVSQVAALYRSQLLDQVVAWQSALAYVLGRG